MRSYHAKSKRRGLTHDSLFHIDMLESRTLLSGGGFTGSGISGAYYNNVSLTGNPSFTRVDDSINFNFGTTASPGGSTSPGFNAIGTTNWSARWTGSIIPQFTETYTFTTVSAAGARLFIEAPGSTTWTNLINDWTSHSATTDNATYALTSGQTYGIKLEYYQSTGPAQISLDWSSPNTPMQAIAPAVPVGINGGTALDYDASEMFADAYKSARLSSWTGISGAVIDSSGWPTGDGSFYLFAGQTANVNGAYTMSFTGQATVSLSLDPISNFSSSYNPASNTTTVTFTDNQTGTGTLQISLSNTRRLPTDKTATGITNISIMRPSAPGSATSFPAGTVFNQGYESLLSDFTAIRFMDAFGMNSNAGQAGGNSVQNWSDLLSPAYPDQVGNNGGYQGQGIAIPYAVELCNETGKDAWINIPLQATDAFVTELADGLKYGFNTAGVPYTAAAINPAYAPLNSNLHAYLELSNEVWNGSFYQASLAASIAYNDVTSGNSDGQIINYDGIDNSSVWTRRWQILRTVEISNDFRAVWGDSAMMSTIRPVFMYQYANDNNSAADPLQFIDNYFNNTNGNHVATPHPVNYFLYAAGGGWYNSVNDSTGAGEVSIANSSFELPAIAASSSTADPTGGSWAFVGSAGVVSNNANQTSAATTTTPGTLTSPVAQAYGEGYEFTVGSQTQYLYQLGRYVVPGNSGQHALFLFNSSFDQLATVTVNTAGQTQGTYVYGSVGPIALSPGKTYYVISTEQSYLNNDQYYGQDTTQTTIAGITIDNAESVNMGNPSWNQAVWTWTPGTSGNHSAGPVNIKVATAQVGTLGYPPDAVSGSQAAYIQGTGSFSQTVAFPAGVSDLTFYAAQGITGSESFTVAIDGTPLPQSYLIPFTPADTYYTFYRTETGLNLSSGTHTISFIGAGNGSVFIDSVAAESADEMLSSGVQNLSPTVVSEVDWDQAFGLTTVGYEGGFEVGGDSPTPASLAANLDPRAQPDTVATLDQYISAGGDLPMVFDAVGGAYAVAASSPYGSDNVYDQSTPKLAGYESAMSALPVSVSNATAVPGTLTPSNLSLLLSDSDGKTYADSAGDIDLDSGWLSWNIVVPSSGTYSISSSTTGTGGSYVLLVDENTVITGASGGSLTGSIALSPGLHDIKVRSTAGSAFKVSSILISENGAPASPANVSGSLSVSTANVTWTPVTNASSYIIGYGTASGQYVNFANEGDVTSAAITGLNPAGVTYLAVYAQSSSGARSLPSIELRLAPRSTDPTALITFEDQSDTPSSGQTHLTEPLLESGFEFTSIGNSAGSALLIEDGSAASNWPGGWASKVLLSEYWGTGIQLTRQDGNAFDLYSLDVVEAQALSAVLTATDASGGTITSIVNFPNDGNQHTADLVLDWADIVKLQVTYTNTAGGAGSSRDGGIDNLLLDDAPPTLSAGASASPANVTGTSTNLSVLGNDQAGQSSLIYTWTATTLPAGATSPLLSANGTNAAQNTTAYFTQAGNYIFTVTISDSYGATTTATVPVTVVQTLTGLSISPASPVVADGATQALVASVGDQFGIAMGSQPSSFSWSMVTAGAGSVNAAGVYTAPASGNGWATISASGGGYSGTVSVYFTSSTQPNYCSGFSTTAGLSLAGGSSVSNNALQLTDASGASETRSAYYASKLPTSSFVTDFTFQNADPVADGFTFTIQNASSTALGSGGTGLGYQGIGSSIALKFDLSGTSTVNTIGLYTDGSAPTTPDNALGVLGLNLLSGDIFRAQIAYNGSNLSLTLVDISQPNDPSITQNYAVNIAAIVGGSSAWFGFTAASGSTAMAQQILSWTYGLPAISISPVMPSILSTALPSLTVNSTRPLSGVSLADMSLMRDSQLVSLAGIPIIGTGNGGLSYTLSNFAAMTAALGEYTFSLAAGGLTDLNGNSPAAGASASWTLNTLTAAANQSITIAGSEGGIASVSVTGSPTYIVNLNDLAQIVVNGLAGAETLSLDFTNGSPVPTGGLTFNGGSGDALTVIGTSSADSASIGGSQLTFDGSAISLPDVPTLTLNTGGGDDTLTQTSQPTATNLTFNGGIGNDQLIVTAGSYSFTADPSPLTSSLTVTASGAATQLTFNPLTSEQVHLAGLTLANGAMATLESIGAARTAASHRVLVIGSAGQTSNPVFNIDSSSTLDLMDNDLIVHGGDAASTSLLLKDGYNSGQGYWNGNGIISSIAATDTLTTLGINQPFAAGAVDGEPVAAADVVVKYAYYGDATLDGVVDGSDYARIDNGYLNHLTGWVNGDFNYDGVINGSDYTLIDNAFNTQAAPLAVIAAVPAAHLSDKAATVWTGIAEPVTFPKLTASHARKLTLPVIDTANGSIGAGGRDLPQSHPFSNRPITRRTTQSSRSHAQTLSAALWSLLYE